MGVPAGSPGLDVPRSGECSTLWVPAWLCHCSHRRCPVLLWPHRSVSSAGSTAFIPPKSPGTQIGENATNLGRTGATALIFFKRGCSVLECLIFSYFFFSLWSISQDLLLPARHCCWEEAAVSSNPSHFQMAIIPSCRRTAGVKQPGSLGAEPASPALVDAQIPGSLPAEQPREVFALCSGDKGQCQGSQHGAISTEEQEKFGVLHSASELIVINHFQRLPKSLEQPREGRSCCCCW